MNFSSFRSICVYSIMYIFGRNPVIEALSSSETIRLEKVFVQYGTEGSIIAAIKQAATRRGVPCVVMDKGKFAALERDALGARSVGEKFDGRTVHGRSQGVIALVAALEILSVEELIAESLEHSEHPMIVALDGITDPHNTGAIARSAECAGAAGLLVAESKTSPLSGAAMKTSAGALEHLRVARTGNLAKGLQDMKNAGFVLIGLDEGGAEPYTNPLYNGAVVMVVGSEGRGLTPAVAKFCDVRVAIPLHGRISSLNASVAAGVVLFEAARQRTSERKSD
jgi:23S rRNA (guanosine2251-2'-O)-methyltransferase